MPQDIISLAVWIIAGFIVRETGDAIISKYGNVRTSKTWKSLLTFSMVIWLMLGIHFFVK